MLSRYMNNDGCLTLIGDNTNVIKYSLGEDLEIKLYLISCEINSQLPNMQIFSSTHSKKKKTISSKPFTVGSALF